MSAHSTVTPSEERRLLVPLRARRCESRPRHRKSSAIPMTPPTTAKPAMTPPFREEPPLLASVLVVVGLPEKVSMALVGKEPRG